MARLVSLATRSSGRIDIDALIVHFNRVGQRYLFLLQGLLQLLEFQLVDRIGNQIQIPLVATGTQYGNGQQSQQRRGHLYHDRSGHRQQGLCSILASLLSYSFPDLPATMTRKLLDCIEIITAEPAEHAVIWLHGLGASGHDFEPIVPELQLLQRPGVRFLFPHAPVRPISINGGAAMRGWYDINSLDFGSRQQDSVGIRESASLVSELIDSQIEAGIPAGNIILAGFSQGGAIALYQGLVGKHQLGGIMALSTYLPVQEIVLPALTEQSRSIPIFMAHGQHDDVIQIRHAEQSRDVMLEHQLNVQWHSYPMPHSVSAEEVAELSLWLKRQFGM